MRKKLERMDDDAINEVVDNLFTYLQSCPDKKLDGSDLQYFYRVYPQHKNFFGKIKCASFCRLPHTKEKLAWVIDVTSSKKGYFTLVSSKENELASLTEEKKEKEEKEACQRKSKIFPSVFFENSLSFDMPSFGIEKFLYCPLTEKLFVDPVITPFGYTFERNAIVSFLFSNACCPISGEPLHLNQLTTNFVVRQIADEVRKTNMFFKF